MAITFNNIPTTVRTPGVYAEIDNSRALQGLVQNPYKALIVGQKVSEGTAELDTLYAISKDGLADGYFGPGSIAARMCNTFKDNNPNTELYAIALGSGIAGTAASAYINVSESLNDATASVAGVMYLMVNGVDLDIDIAIGDSGMAIASLVVSTINADSTLPCRAAHTNGSIYFSAVNSGTLGNYIDIRKNYFDGQSDPLCFSVFTITGFAGGSVDPDLGDAWAVIAGEQYHIVVNPYIDAANLTELEGELSDRFDALEDAWGHGFTGLRGTQASCTTLGNSRNSPHNTIMGAYDSPTGPEEWAAGLGAVAAANLNIDPARPLHFLQLKGILPPPVSNRFTRAERDILLYDGIATFVVDNGGNVLIERSITSYQTNALGLSDPSYLDVQTLATLAEIRLQYKTRMANRFLIPRYKLADDTFPAQPGSYVVTPKTIKQETISLFTELRDIGLVENLDEFIANLIVERDSSDNNRVNVLLPPDLINQFRVLATLIQFIL